MGTSVRDSTNEASKEKITAMAMGANRNCATPLKKNIGRNTTQIHSTDTSAGSTICWAPSRIAVSRSLPISRCELMFSMVTVASSTRMPMASAKPLSVMMLMV